MGFVAAGWMKGRPPRAWYSADSRTTAAVFTFCPRVDVRVPSYTPDAHPPGPVPAGATVATQPEKAAYPHGDQEERPPPHRPGAKGRPTKSG